MIKNQNDVGAFKNLGGERLKPRRIVCVFGEVPAKRKCGRLTACLKIWAIKGGDNQNQQKERPTRGNRRPLGRRNEKWKRKQDKHTIDSLPQQIVVVNPKHTRRLDK
jgi:hypothetical protein